MCCGLFVAYFYVVLLIVLGSNREACDVAQGWGEGKGERVGEIIRMHNLCMCGVVWWVLLLSVVGFAVKFGEFAVLYCVL